VPGSAVIADSASDASAQILVNFPWLNSLFRFDESGGSTRSPAASVSNCSPVDYDTALRVGRSISFWQFFGE
jgi:hypothetical protein